METLLVHPQNSKQLDAIKAILKVLNVPFEAQGESLTWEEELPAHVIAGIRKGREDAKAGRTISFEAFKEKLAKK